MQRGGTIKISMFMILPTVWSSLGLFLARPESMCKRQTHRHAQTHTHETVSRSALRRVQCWIRRKKRPLHFNLCSWAKEKERSPSKCWPWNQETGLQVPISWDFAILLGHESPSVGPSPPSIKWRPRWMTLKVISSSDIPFRPSWSSYLPRVCLIQ